MARKRGLLEKATELKKTLSRSDSLRKHAEWQERHLDRDAKGRFVSRKQEKANRDYLVTLRAQINHEDFKAFRGALDMITEDVSSWASKIGTTLGWVGDAFNQYKNIGLGGVQRESAAIDFANRLGLTLPQGRAWSRTFGKLNITSFDQWAEVTRNPLRLAKALNIYQEEERASREMEAPEVQEGIGVFAKFDRALDTASIRVKNFGEQVVLTTTKTSGLIDKLSDIIQNFNPRVDPKSFKQTVKNVAKEAGEVVSDTKKAIDEGFFPGFTSPAVGVGISTATKLLSKAPSLAALGVATEAAVTGEAPWRSMGYLGATLGLQHFFPALSKLMGLGNVAFSLQGGFDQTLAQFPRDVTWKQRFGFENYTPEQLKAKERGEWVTDWEKLGESFYDFQKALGIWWGEYQKDLAKKYPVEDINLEFTGTQETIKEGPLKGQKVTRSIYKPEDTDLAPQQEYKPEAPTNISVSVGDIIVNVPAGSDGREIGRTVAKEIARSFSDGIIPYDQQLSARLGRVR